MKLKVFAGKIKAVVKIGDHGSRDEWAKLRKKSGVVIHSTAERRRHID